MDRYEGCCWPGCGYVLSEILRSGMSGVMGRSGMWVVGTCWGMGFRTKLFLATITAGLIVGMFVSEWMSEPSPLLRGG